MPEHHSPGDWPTLAADLFERYHEEVVARLRATYPTADMEMRHDAFVQALLELARKPDVVDPGRGDWPDLLTGAAKRVLWKKWQSAQAGRQREQEYGEDYVAERESADRDIVDGLADAEVLQKARAELADNDEERVVLDHWGEDFRVVAQALRLSHLAEVEQQDRVKDIRDRLGKRIKRWKGKP
jgi:hypothetical protein